MKGGLWDLQGQALTLPADLFISVLPHEADDQKHDGIQLDLQVHIAVRLEEGRLSGWLAGCGWTRLAYPLWRRRVMRSRRKSCAVSTNVLDSRVTKATVAQGIKQREDSGFKLCSSHNCAGLRPKVKAGSGPKWLPSAPQEWVQRRSHNSLNNFLHCKWNRKHFSSFCCGSRLKTVWDASGIVGLSLLKGHFDTRGHRQLGAEFMQFSG